MNLPGETEAGSAGTQPYREIAWRAHRNAERSAAASLPRSSKLHIGSVDPDALKIPARRAEYLLAKNAPSPFQAEATHIAALQQISLVDVVPPTRSHIAIRKRCISASIVTTSIWANCRGD